MNTLMKTNRDLLGGFIENLWNDASPLFRNELNGGSTMPAVNIINNENDFEIEVAAPGLKKEDFNIEVEDHILKLSVDKETNDEVKEENFTRKEFSYFKFERRFTLPKNVVDTENVEATYNEGILNIRLPKAEQKNTVKKIAVQ